MQIVITRRMNGRLLMKKLAVLVIITVTILILTERTRTRVVERFDVSQSKQDDGANHTGVIILTYMRSGSSLTGDILQQNDNVFYVFEPLRIIHNLIKMRRPIQWLNGSISAMDSLNTVDF